MARLQLADVQDSGNGALIVESAPLSLSAAIRVSRQLNALTTIVLSPRSLKRVLQIPGRTTFTSMTAHSVHDAVQSVCMQCEADGAEGALLILSISPQSAVVPTIRSAVRALNHAMPGAIATTMAFAHDDVPQSRVEASLLLTGLH